MSLEYRRELTEKLDHGTLAGMDMDEKFNFFCRDECMGRCCNTISIMLDPWDVEIMARHLGMPGRDFLSEYCVYEVDHRVGWPFARFKHAEKGPCIFMQKDGKCRVYPARSRNCRTYPIGRAVRLKPGENENVKEEIFFMVERQPFCFGHGADRSWTLREWLEDSGAQKMYELFDIYMEVIHYCTEELGSRRWMSDRVAQMMAPLLFGPDMLRAKLGIDPGVVGHEEFYRRRMKALRVVLNDIAAGFGFGPGAGSQADLQPVSMMERMKEILVRG